MKVDGELEKECGELRLEDGEHENKLEKVIVQLMKEKLRKVKRQTRHRKQERKKNTKMIENVIYDGYRISIEME